MKLLGNLKKGLLFVVSAPAGTGKTTLVKMLMEEFPCIKASISCTTRHPRKGETPDVDYFFISREQFQKKILAGDFFEYAEVFGDYYGTCKESVIHLLEKGMHVVLVIDTQGASQVRKQIKSTHIFISPPSMEELHKRLHERKTETSEVIERRLAWAENELQRAHGYDYQIVNDNLQVAYQVLRSIFIAEEHRNNIN